MNFLDSMRQKVVVLILLMVDVLQRKKVADLLFTFYFHVYNEGVTKWD